MTALWLGLIAIISAILGPLILALFQRITANEVARRLLRSNADVARQAKVAHAETTSALNAIHTLVNSNLTSAQHRELDASRAMLAAMREVITLKEDRGVPVAPETIDAVKRAEMRIAELARDLIHKQQQTDIADAQRDK